MRIVADGRKPSVGNIPIPGTEPRSGERIPETQRFPAQIRIKIVAILSGFDSVAASRLYLVCEIQRHRAYALRYNSERRCAAHWANPACARGLRCCMPCGCGPAALGLCGESL